MGCLGSSRPSCVLDEDLLQINLWLGAMETTTNLHYDANHNLLFVLKGNKRVSLLPPSATAEVHAMPVSKLVNFYVLAVLMS